MYLIGLTGGIASGKSVVAAQLADLGAVVVDADVLAREVVEPGSKGLALIAEAFGDGVLCADGSLDRPALGAIVFTDPVKRDALNAITHPAIWNRAKDLFAAAVEKDPDAIIVYDVPLLAEAAGDRPMKFDLVVVVQASVETRIHRMTSERRMSRDEAESRIRAQASDEDRLRLADVVIDSDGTMEHTVEQVDALWISLPYRMRVV
jgi:dephospho-CoA kinase